MLFSYLWAYRTIANITTRFEPFQLVYGLETTHLIKCEIPPLKLADELLPDTSPKEENLLYLKRLDETHCIIVLVIEAEKKRVKA